MFAIFSSLTGNVSLCLIPSHAVAQWLLSHIHHFLDMMGLRRDHVTESIIYVIVITVLALLLGWLVRKGVIFAARRYVIWSKSQIGKQLLHYHIFTKTTQIIPPLVVLALMPFAFTGETQALKVFYRIVVVYAVVMFTIALVTMARFFYHRYNDTRNPSNLPLDGIVNTVVIVLWVICAIVSASVLVGKSPAYLLTGLGAFAAALMLIFRDSLLGLVAGIQLSQNDMLHVGDWIMVPNTPADGTVLDVSLSRVKIQNFDNTIVTLPPYTLVSTSFQNYRGMTMSGARRITMTLLMDCDSVKPVEKADVQSLAQKLPLLQQFVTRLDGNGGKPEYLPGLDVVNGTIDTNLGLMRAYMCRYVLSNDQFSHTQQVLMRVLDPTPQGVPMQMYCFTATTEWTTFEAIRSALVEHAISVAPLFGLRVFNAPSGNDIDEIMIHGK